MKFNFWFFKRKEPAFKEAYLELSKYRSNLLSVMWRIKTKMDVYRIKAEKGKTQEERAIYAREFKVLSQIYDLTNKLDAVLLKVMLRLDNYSDFSEILSSFKETNKAISRLRPELEALSEAYGAIIDELNDASQYFRTLTVNGETIQVEPSLNAEEILKEAVDKSVELEMAEEGFKDILLKAARDGEYAEMI